MYDSARESFEYCIPVIMKGKRKKSLIEVMIEDESQIVKSLLEEDFESPPKDEMQSIELELHNRIVDANIAGVSSNVTERAILEAISELCDKGKW